MSVLTDPEDDRPLHSDPNAVTLPPAPRVPAEFGKTEPKASSGPPTERPEPMTSVQAEEILQAIRASESVIAGKVTESLKGFLGDHLLNFRQSVHDEIDGTISAFSRMLDTKFSELLSELDRRYDTRLTTVKGELDVVAGRTEAAHHAAVQAYDFAKATSEGEEADSEDRVTVISG